MIERKHFMHLNVGKLFEKTFCKTQNLLSKKAKNQTNRKFKVKISHHGWENNTIFPKCKL